MVGGGTTQGVVPWKDTIIWTRGLIEREWSRKAKRLVNSEVVLESYASSGTGGTWTYRRAAYTCWSSATFDRVARECIDIVIFEAS